MGRGLHYTTEEVSMMTMILECNPYMDSGTVARLLHKYDYCKNRKLIDLKEKVARVKKDISENSLVDGLRRENEALKTYIESLEKIMASKQEKAEKYDDLIQNLIGGMRPGKTSKGAEMPFLNFIQTLQWLSENEKGLYNARVNEIGLGNANTYREQLLWSESV